jgi:hypothetical protein
MSKRSTEIKLDDAEEGMELAADLVDARGTVLLQKGSVLSASVVTALGRRGVERIRILADAPLLADGPELDAARERVRSRLAHLFRRAEGAAAQELRARLEEYRLEQLA